MNAQILPAFHVIGIAVRTTNENGQAGIDIPALWQRFMTEGIAHQIPNKIDDTVYCMYTDYEKDYTRPYTTLLGCRVAHVDYVPEGMVGKTISEASYVEYTAKGSILEGMVFGTWTEIWNTDLPRAYTADFEVYGEKAQNPTNAEVPIFVAVR